MHFFHLPWKTNAFVVGECLFQKLWRELIALLQSREDLDLFAEYMKDEMTYDEFGTLGEIIDEINKEYVTEKFVNSCLT